MGEKKIKILFLDHTPFVGGAQLSLVQHLEKIDRDRFEPIVVCAHRAEDLGLTARYESAGVKYFFIPFGRLKSYSPVVIWKLAASIIGLTKLAKREQADLIFGNTVRADIVGGLAALFSGIKMIWFIQDSTFPKFLFHAFKFIPRKIIFVSRAMADYYGVVPDNNKHEVVHIWRDLHERKYLVADEQIEEIRKRWGAHNDTPVIGFVGRLVESKGPQILIEAIDILIKNGRRNIKCIFVGTGGSQEGNNEKALRASVKVKGLENTVIFVGHQKKIYLFIRAMDVVCIPSLIPEAFPAVAVEAMMLKVPVVAAEIGGIPEIVRHEETGLLFPPGDGAALSRVLARLADNNVRRKQLVDKASAYVMAHCTSERGTRRLEKIYADIFYIF